MKIFGTITSIITFCLFLIAPGISSEDYGSFNLKPGVRASAMAGTFVAIADDPSTVFWNPAGLTNLKTVQLYPTYTSWYNSTSETGLSYSFPVNNAAWSWSIRHLDYRFLYHQTTDLINICYANKPTPYLSWGIGYNYFSDIISDVSYTNQSVDIGFLIKPPKLPKNVAIGVSSRRIFSLYDSFLNNLTAGISYKKDLKSGGVNATSLIAVDVEVQNNQKPIYHLGAEYNIVNMTSIFVGVNSDKDNSTKNYFGGGLSLFFNPIRLDFAYLPHQNLGNTYKLAVNISQ
ncbi:UPF0164 family protein [Candidatus Margulisiibacteriota bacterium]